MEITIKEELGKKDFLFIEGEWKRFEQEKHIIYSFDKYYICAADNDIDPAGCLELHITCDAANVKDIIVKKEKRSKGIGKALVKKAEKFAKSKGCHVIEIKTCPELMPEAHSFYKKQGYIEEAVLKNNRYKKDWVLLKKHIN